MLEEIDSRPVTTAALAKKVGVSEAALYRHFPSKGLSQQRTHVQGVD